MLQFEGYTLDVMRGALRAADRDVELRPKSFEVLRYLVENSDRLVSKEELISKVMFLLNAPAQRIATALAAVPRGLAVVTSEAAKANKFGGAGGTAPAAETA